MSARPQLVTGLAGLLAVSLAMAGTALADAGAPDKEPAGGGASAGPALSFPSGAGAPASGVSDAGTSAPTALPDAGATGEPAVRSCSEHVPEGKSRPVVSDQLPSRGVSGHVVVLEIVVEHGKGETVLPDGFRVQFGSDELHLLEEAGFVLPHPDGGAGPTLQRESHGEGTKTTVRIPLVPLPPEPGRHELVLPPLPVAIARASGELITVCTKEHRVVVEDPIANSPDAQPRENPPPRRQLEEWTTAKHVAFASLIALLVGALVAWLVGRWLRRPRPAPPPPPARPPWEVAFEELHDIRQSNLVQGRRYAEHFDRVSFTVRKYLGDRYGFDGLESTTRESLGVLRRVVPPIRALSDIERFLRHADLVKFARLTPTAEECLQALDAGEQIVQRTVPAFGPPAPSPGSDPAAPSAPDPAAGVDQSQAVPDVTPPSDQGGSS